MTTTAATIGLTYDGTDIQDLDGLFLEITQGLDDSPTSVRGVDVTVPGADGQTARPRRFHERRIVLAGFVRGSGFDTEDRQADYRANVRDMLVLFETGGGAAYTPADLVVTLEDGSTQTVQARTLSVITVPVIPSEYSSVSVELLVVAAWTVEALGS